MKMSKSHFVRLSRNFAHVASFLARVLVFSFALIILYLGIFDLSTP